MRDDEAQPLIGYEVRRQGLSLSGKYNVSKNYFVNGNVIFDLSRHYYNGLNGTAPLFSVAGLGVGGGLSGRLHDIHGQLHVGL